MIKGERMSMERCSLWTVRVDLSHALRGNAARDALRHIQSRTRSVRRGIPTQSVGTIGG